MPGDDIRGIDWRLYARSDRYYVKQFEADTNTNFMVLLDTSPSMRYRGATERSGSVSKLDYGCFLRRRAFVFLEHASAIAWGSRRLTPTSSSTCLLGEAPPLVLHALERTMNGAAATSAETVRAPVMPPRNSTLEPPLRKLSESLRAGASCC